MGDFWYKIREGFFFEWSLILIAFCLPLYPKLLYLMIGGATLFWLLKKDLGKRIKTAITSKVFMLLVLFYALHILSFLVSKDKVRAGNDLQTKLSMLLFPLFFMGSGGFFYIKKEWLKKSFIYGLLLSILICLFVAFQSSFNNPHTGGEFNISIWYDMINKNWLWLLVSGNSFFNYSLYSHFIHPSYFALYLTFGAFLLTIKSENGKHLIANKVVRNVLIFILLFNVFLLQSRAGLIGMFIYAIWSLVVASRRTKVNILYMFLIVVAIIAIILTGRFERIVSNFSSFSWKSLQKTEIRLSIWKDAVKVIREKPLFGYGIGDGKSILISQYGKDSLKEAKNERYNAHNEFLEVLIQLGFVGLFVLLAILIYPVFVSNINLHIYLFFLILILLHFIFESMLERIAGVSFITYFYCYLNTLGLKHDTIFSSKN